MPSRRDLDEPFWLDSPGQAEILARSCFFQSTAELDVLVEASRLHRVVVLTGKAGAGKSSLVTALALPEIADGRVPDGFVHAIAILTNDTNPASLGDDLESQLRRSVPGFAEAVAEFGRSVSLPEREKSDALARKVIQPLACFVEKPDLRIVLDGFDRLQELTRDAICEAVAASPENLRFVITARPGTSGCPSGYMLDHTLTPRDAFERYLTCRQVPASAHPAIVDRADGHWLFTRLLADLIENDPTIDLAQLPNTVNETYAKLLARLHSTGASSQTFSHVLRLLALAGEGPVLPLTLLARACQTLGSPEGSHGVRDVLDDLGGLVVRRDSGTAEEHVGLFHGTLAEYLFDASAPDAGFPLDAKAMHEAIIQAIEELTTTAIHDPGDPVHRYAMLREPDHQWALGNAERTLASLRRRDLHGPRENLQRSLHWLGRFREHFDEDNPNVLDVRGSVASWTGRAGNNPEALRLCAELLVDQERALGRDSPITLTTRGRIACCAADMGDVQEAIRLCAELLLDQERVLGRDHADSIKTRGWIAAAADVNQMMMRLALLERCMIAARTAHAGDLQEALRLFAELLPDQERTLGPDSEDTIGTRIAIAFATKQLGHAREALRLWAELLPDQERVLGHDHADTLETRMNVASCTSAAGEAREALRLFTELLPHQERVLGHDHAATLRSRGNIAYCTGETGDARGALRLSVKLLKDQERLLGRDHKDAFYTRGNIARWLLGLGKPRRALRIASELLSDQERVLGPGDKNTLNTHSMIASLTGDVGEGWEVLRLFTELLSRQESELGPDASDVLTTRSNVAIWTVRVGNRREALRLLTELLPDQERVLGHDHPDALSTRVSVADCTGELGDSGEALRLLAALLPVEERVLGRDHPTTLTTLMSLAKFAIGNNDRAEACRWLHDGLERALARFGSDHLMTKGFRKMIEACGCDGPISSGARAPDRPGRRRRRGRGPFPRDGGSRRPP